MLLLVLFPFGSVLVKGADWFVSLCSQIISFTSSNPILKGFGDLFAYFDIGLGDLFKSYLIYSFVVIFVKFIIDLLFSLYYDIILGGVLYVKKNK